MIRAASREKSSTATERFIALVDDTRSEEERTQSPKLVFGLFLAFGAVLSSFFLRESAAPGGGEGRPEADLAKQGPRQGVTSNLEPSQGLTDASVADPLRDISQSPRFGDALEETGNLLPQPELASLRLGRQGSEAELFATSSLTLGVPEGSLGLIKADTGGAGGASPVFGGREKSGGGASSSGSGSSGSGPDGSAGPGRTGGGLPDEGPIAADPSPGGPVSPETPGIPDSTPDRGVYDLAELFDDLGMVISEFDAPLVDEIVSFAVGDVLAEVSREKVLSEAGQVETPYGQPFAETVYQIDFATRAASQSPDLPTAPVDLPTDLSVLPAEESPLPVEPETLVM